MNLARYLELMNFPEEWREWKMLPEKSYMDELISTYTLGMENASEHDRNSCFHWWLKRNPNEQQLLYLAKLSKLDPDNIMSQDINTYIKKAKDCSEKVRKELC